MGQFFTTTTDCRIGPLGNVQFAADDLLFDWTAVQIPKGAASLSSITGYVMGLDEANQASSKIIDLYFAKSIDAVAPSSMGTVNSALTIAGTAAFRRNLIGYISLDLDERTDSTDPLTSYNALGISFNDTKNTFVYPMVMQGEAEGSTSDGFQTIYVAGIAQGTFNFGTGVLIAGEHAADDLTVTVDGNNANGTFSVGDEIVAANAANGAGEVAIGKITALTDTVITVDAAPNTVTDDFEVLPKHPLRLILGWSY